MPCNSSTCIDRSGNLGLLLFCTLVHAIKGDVFKKKREGGRKRGREEEREGGREEGRKRGREEEREGGREGGKEGGRENTTITLVHSQHIFVVHF